MKVLIVEDDMQSASAVAVLLEGQGIAAEIVLDGGAGLSRAGDPSIDLVILDRMLPVLDGLSVAARMRGAGLDKPILILSALGQIDQRVAGLDGGADDYLGKPFEPTELVARVRALLRRAGARSRQPILFHGDIELHVPSRTAHRGGRHLGLSPKEFDLLTYLVENAGEIVTREMLLRHVWQLSFDPRTNVVDVNVVRLRRKLEHEFATSGLETIRGCGYRLTLPPVEP